MPGIDLMWAIDLIALLVGASGLNTPFSGAAPLLAIDPLTIMAGAGVIKSLFGKGPKQYSPREIAEGGEGLWNRQLLAKRKDDQGRLREALQAEQFGSQNPYYNTQWTGTPGGADRQRITTLNEADQQNLDSRRGVDSRLLAMILGGRQQGG